MSSVQPIHDHTLDIGVSLGPLGLRVALLVVVTAVAGYALLRPFLPAELGGSARWVTIAAGCGVLVAVLLADGTAVPQPAVALLVAVAVVPIYATHGGGHAGWRLLRPAAPVVLAVTAAGAIVQFARALLDDAAPQSVAVYCYDGVLLALIGLSWYVLCRHRSRAAARISAGGTWLLATVTVAGAGQVSMLTLS